MTGAPILELDQVYSGYGRLSVLRDISLTVDSGEIVVLLGANGAGKTTTLRTVNGLIRPTAGQVRLDGAAVNGRAPERIARMGLGHVPQGRGTFSQLTVNENLLVGAVSKRSRTVQSDLEEWFGVFPRLAERREQPAGSMSGGEQQMLAIARAMMAHPRVLMLDEPSLGLAPNLTEEIFAHLSQINASTGTAMLVVEQNAHVALAVAHRAYVLEAGELVLSGPADELQNDERVRRAYLRV